MTDLTTYSHFKTDTDKICFKRRYLYLPKNVLSALTVESVVSVILCRHKQELDKLG